MVIVGFEFMNYSVVESETAANVCVIVTGEIERSVAVTIFIPVAGSGK